MQSRPDQNSVETPVLRRSYQRPLRMVVMYIVVPYIAVVLIMATFQRRLMYQPSVARNPPATASTWDRERIHDVQLQTPDGTVLNGWLMSAQAEPSHQPQPSDSEDEPAPLSATSRNTPLVIYFPGNAGNRFRRVQDLFEFAACGFDVLIFDYRGYGDSTGSPSEPALTSDARLVWNFASQQLEYPPERIVIFGESLGGAVALSLWSAENSSPPQPAALILNATFTSMADTVAWHYPWFPFRYLLLDPWPSIQRISSVSSPIIIFHGSADQIVPIEHGRKLASEATNAELIEIPDGEHNDIPMNRLRIVLRQLQELPERGSMNW